MTIWDFINANPGYTLVFLIVICITICTVVDSWAGKE